jgi:intracellular septation protein A
MSLLGTVTAAPTEGCASAHRPSLVMVIRRVSLSLLIACIIPATLFYVALQVAGVWTAIVAALVWSYGAIIWRKATRRRTSGLLILTAVLLTGRTVISLIADSTFLYFLQPIISDGVVATAFLLSLASARPLVARLAGDFYPMDHELHLRPRIQRLFWWLTAMWAAICVGRALICLWLLTSQSIETFVLVKSIFMLTLNVVAVAVTIGASALVARKEGLMGPRLAPVPA